MKNRARAGRVRAGDRGAARTRAAQVRAYKISKRFDCDISAVCAGLAIELDGDSRRRGALRVRRHGGDGASAPRGAEAALVGQPWNEATLERRAAGARARLHAAHRHARERRLPPAGRAEPAAPLLARDAPDAPLPAERSSVWSAAARARAGSRPLRARRSRREPALDPAARGQSRSATSTRPPRASTPPARPHRGRRARRHRRPHESAHLHVAGAAPYVDDLPELAGTLHAALGLSPVAHGRLARDRPRPHRARCPASSPCCRRADIPGRTTAARSSTTTRSSPTARSTTSASRCSR